MCANKIQTALFVAMFLCFGIIQVHSQAVHIINSTGDTLLHVNNNGNVGIGTAGPAQKLHIENSSSGGSAYLRIETSHPTNWHEAGLRIKTPQNTWHLRLDRKSTTLLYTISKK